MTVELVRHWPTIARRVYWDGTQETLNELRGLGLNDFRLEPASTQGDLDVLVIRTLEGERPALLGDAVIDGVANLYPIKPDVDARSYGPYESVDELAGRCADAIQERYLIGRGNALLCARTVLETLGYHDAEVTS